MDLIRRRLLLAAVAGSGLTLSGCVTNGLYESLLRKPGYRERIDTVLFTPDHRHMIIIGANYHYLFDMPETLSRVFADDLHSAVSAEFGAFRLNADNTIDGSIKLLLAPTASDAQRSAATAAGFDVFRRAELRLHGTRYRAGGVQAQAARQRLNERYSVEILEEPGTGSKIAAAALTPVTLAADGVLILAGAPLLLGWGVIGVMCGVNGDSGCH